MSLEIGSIVEGVVTGITNFGAFVRLPEGNTGLIHISEVADAYVEDVRRYLKEKDRLQVKILGKNEKGKYDLSLKQAKQTTEPESPQEKDTEGGEPRDLEKEKVKAPEDIPRHSHRKEEYQSFEKKSSFSFEDRLSRFMKESDEKLLDLKKNTEAKRGRGKGR